MLFKRCISLLFFFVDDSKYGLVLLDEEARHLVELAFLLVISSVLSTCRHPHQSARDLCGDEHLLVETQRAQLRQVLHALTEAVLLILLDLPAQNHHLPRVGLAVHHLLLSITAQHFPHLPIFQRHPTVLQLRGEKCRCLSVITMMMSSNMSLQNSNLSSSRFPLRSKEKEFLTKEVIGRGSFGEVEKCENVESGKMYAIKTIMVNRLYLDSIEEEARNMRMLNSEYVLELVDSFYDDHLGSYVLVTPYYKLGSFQQLMSREWELDELLLFFYQMAKAHFELSKNGICHLDLKPENILLESNTQYVLCDLGCSRKLEQGSMTASFNALKISTNARGGGTTEYGSPDLVINGEMTDFSDIWSLGVILYKIIFRKHPLMTLPINYSQKLNSFLKGDVRIEYPQNKSSAKFAPIVDILKRMLVCSRNKEMRIKWDDILEKIYKVVGVPAAQRPYIITNFDSLLHFTDAAMVLLSSLLYYTDQFTDFFMQQKIDTKSLSREICIYLLTLTHELVTHTGDVKQDFWMFYLFEVTRRNLTKKQKSFAFHLEKEALRLAADRAVSIEYENLLIFWERVVISCGKLYKSVNGLTPPKNVCKQVELKKIIDISNFIAFDYKLQYKNKRKLQEFVAQLINS